MLKLTGLGCFLVLAGVSGARAAPDCSNAGNQTAMNICADDTYKAADKALNAQYAQTRKAVLAYDPEGDKLLIAAQRAWVVFRDAHCAAESFSFKGGTMEPTIRGMCLAEATDVRTAQLKKMLETYLH
jgi:uncharacterized protein YecT (DUF1311 family)